MRNLPFVLWLLFFPLFISIDNYLVHLSGKKYSEGVELMIGLIELVTLVGIAHLLYEKHEPKI